MPRKGEIKNRNGEKYITKEGYPFEIIESFGSYNYTIRLEDENNTILKNIAFKEIKSGSIANPYHRSVCGIGYHGVGKYVSSINGRTPLVYECWNSILKRCHNKNKLEKRPTYKGVTICEEWKCLQNFGVWYDENFKNTFTGRWELDKDILFKGNKIYSPETCCFVPAEINSLFTKNNARRGKYPIGVSKKGKKYRSQIQISGSVDWLGDFDTIEEAFKAYKTAKEIYIKKLANKYRGQITESCYYAMCNYEVEITD